MLKIEKIFSKKYSRLKRIQVKIKSFVNSWYSAVLPNYSNSKLESCQYFITSIKMCLQSAAKQIQMCLCDCSFFYDILFSPVMVCCLPVFSVVNAFNWYSIESQPKENSKCEILWAFFPWNTSKIYNTFVMVFILVLLDFLLVNVKFKSLNCLLVVITWSARVEKAFAASMECFSCNHMWNVRFRRAFWV